MTERETADIPRSIVLVGLMGAGKTCIGRELASRYKLPFTDADEEIETAAGCSIEDIFALYGEQEFRSGERRVIARLLDRPTQILATGGGAFMDLDTRTAIRSKAISVWLRADLDLLLSRVMRRDNRPLLKDNDPREVLKGLIAVRYPIYSEADLVVDTTEEKPRATAARVAESIAEFLAEERTAQPVT